MRSRFSIYVKGEKKIDLYFIEKNFSPKTSSSISFIKVSFNIKHFAAFTNHFKLIMKRSVVAKGSLWMSPTVFNDSRWILCRYYCVITMLSKSSPLLFRNPKSAQSKTKKLKSASSLLSSWGVRTVNAAGEQLPARCLAAASQCRSSRPPGRRSAWSHDAADAPDCYEQ